MRGVGSVLLAAAAFAQAIATRGGYTVHSALIEASEVDGAVSLRLDFTHSRSDIHDPG